MSPGTTSEMKKRKRKADDRGGLTLLGEAFHQLRTAPLALLVVYYAGAIPFVLGALFFWTDMSYSAFARERCVPASLGMAVLFLWMKCCQTVFASSIRTRFAGLPRIPWTPARFLRMASTQLAIQAHGLWLLPVTTVLLFPLNLVYGFFQNATVYGDGSNTGLRDLVRTATREAVRWPRQSWVVVWLVSPWILGTAMLLVFGTMRIAMSGYPELQSAQNAAWFVVSLLLIFNFLVPFCPFSGAVAGNIAIAIVALPYLARQLFGIESVFSTGGFHGIFNSTFLMTVFGLTFLCLDPLVKTAYAIRCFYGESQVTGNDLIAEWNG